MMKKVFAPALLVVLFGVLLVELPLTIAARADDYDFFDPILEVRHLLNENFVERPDEETHEQWQRVMIDAMVSSLDDPYTQYVPPQDVARFTKQLSGTYVGIGAEINIVDGWLTIVSPMEDSPALEAGVIAGDTVLEIEGETTYQMSADEAIELLTGEPGTEVTIKVRHTNGEEEFITITRRRIVARTVKGVRRVGEDWNYMLDPALGIGYIRITQFNETTVDGVRRALGELLDDGLEGLVLDLRFDPGGELSSAVQVADFFLRDGVIVSVRGRNARNETFRAQAPGTAPDFPMIVIVNDTSASASEIVAGALQDNDRAVVLGERTYGKGSVQEVRRLSPGLGTLKLTTAHYYLPSGRNIHRTPDSTVWGVDPTDGFRVEMSDTQYRDMLQNRREFEVIQEPQEPADHHWADPEWIAADIGDVQLAGALRAVQARVRGEEWPHVGEEAGDAVAMEEELDEAMQIRNRLAMQLARAEERLLKLTDQASEAGFEPIIPEDVDLTAGEVTVTDRSGKVVGVYRILDEDFGLTLQFAGVEPVEPVEPEGEPVGSGDGE